MQFAVLDAFNGLFNHPDVPSIEFLKRWKSDNHYQRVIHDCDDVTGLCKSVDPTGRRLLIVPLTLNGDRQGNAVYFEEAPRGRVAYHGPGDIEGILSGSHDAAQQAIMFTEEWLEVCPAETMGPSKLLLGTAQMQGIPCISPVIGSE